MIGLERDMVTRWSGNPAITLDHMTFPVLNIMSAGATRYKKQYCLLVRVEKMSGTSVFVLARSMDGLHFTVDPQPILEPAKTGPFAEFENRGVEDPRITHLDGIYYIVYVGSSWHGHRLILAKTKDFKKIERVAFISEPGNKNGMLFPKKIGTEYARLERPEERSNIWISYSKDLIHWGRSAVVLKARGSGFWDADRVGGACPPILTEKGWLVIYYGQKDTSGGRLYRLGAMLLDKKQPEKVIGRSQIPILSPREEYERVGDLNNKVFSCGAILKEETQDLLIYYGAADTVVCVGTAKVADICERCVESND